MYIHRNARKRNHNFIKSKEKRKKKALAIDRSRPNPLRLNCISSLHAHSHSQTHTPTYTHHSYPRTYFPPELRPTALLSLRARPFSRSSGRSRGVGGMSSLSFVRPLRLERVEPLTERGNSDRLGVRAVATFFVDLRIVSLMVHSRFLAMKKREAVVTSL